MDMDTNVGPELAVGAPLDGYEGNLRLVSLQLPRHNAGPFQQIVKNITLFEQTTKFRTGWFTSNMEGFDKLNSHFEMYLLPVPGWSDLNGHVDVYVRTMENPEFAYLGRATKFGRNVMPFGVLPDDGFPAGLAAQGIEFEYEWWSDDPSKSPIIAYTVLKYIKLPLPGRAWMSNVPLQDANYNGMGPAELDEFLAERTWAPEFTKFIHGTDGKGRPKPWRARMAQHQAIEGSGLNPFRNTVVNMVEVRIPGYDFNPDTGKWEFTDADDATIDATEAT
jgi:hypothetical protein